MADKWDSNGEIGRLDLSLAVTDSQELIHDKGLRTDVREDGREGHILSTDQEASTTFIPHQQMKKPKQTEVVEVNRFHGAQWSKAGRITDKHAPPSDIHCLSNTMAPEEKPAIEDTQNRSSSFSDPVYVSVEKKDTLGYRYYLGMKTHREAAAFEGAAVAPLYLSSRKKGDPTHSNMVLEPWQPQVQHPPNNQAFTLRPAVDERGDVATSHQTLSLVENQEENVTFCSVLHQMQRQQKRKAGQHFKKETLPKMAKLFVLAQRRDSEIAEMSQPKSPGQTPVECERSETQKTQDTLQSSESNAVNVTDSVDDRGNDPNHKETAPPTKSVDMISAGKTTTAKMLTELTKTQKRKKKPTTSAKQKSRNSTKMVPTTKILENPVLPQDTQLLSRQAKQSKVQKRSKEINSTTLKEESKTRDNSHIHSSNNNTSSNPSVSNHDATPKPNTSDTPKDSEDSNSAAVNDNITESSSEKSVGCNGVTSPQSVTEGPLVLSVTQKDQRMPNDGMKNTQRTSVAECSTAAVTHVDEPSGIESTGELLKSKRKPVRPFRKKRRMKMAQLLAVAQEGGSNSNEAQCNVTEGTVLFPQQQRFPYLPQAPSKVKKTKKDANITASSWSASPVRMLPRTQSRTPNLKPVENIDGLVYTSLETVLITSGSIEPIIKVETSTGAPLLVPSNELSIQSETQGTTVENIKEWSVHSKENPKRRTSTRALRDSRPPQSVVDESVENGLTKTMKASRKEKTIASKSKRKTGCNTVKLHSSCGITKKVQSRTGHDEVYDIPAQGEANPIPQLQKPMTHGSKSKECKVEPTDSPLPCQEEPPGSLCESGVMGHGASSPEPAWELVTPPVTKKINSKTKRAGKRPSQKSRIEPVLTLNTTIGGESRSLCVQCSTLDGGKIAKEETSVVNDLQKPPKGTAQRQSRNGGEKRDGRKQTVEEKCVQPEQITSQQPDSFPTKIETEPDETCATPMKVTKAKEGKNAVSLIAGNILCTADRSLKQLGSEIEKLETDDISTAKHAAFVATDDKHDQNETLQGSLATSNITNSEGAVATHKIVSRQTETNDRTIVSTHITSMSMLQNSSPAPQSVSTVTSLTVKGQIIESKPCSQGTILSNVMAEETLANHGPDLEEHKTPLQSLITFVQDTYEDPKIFKINHTGQSTKYDPSNSEISKEYFKASETFLDEIVPAAYIDMKKEVEQDESISSVAQITNPQTKTSKRKRRRNKTGWATKRKSKRLCRNVNTSTAVEVVDHSSVDNSGLSFNSSLCNSILDEEIVSLELKDVKGNLNESRSSEVSSTDVNIKQTHTAVDRNDIKDMAANTKSKHSAKLKHSPTRQQKPKKKPIECSFCGRSFRHISAFTVHKRIHTGEKPYRCLSCGKGFAQLPKLYLHSSIHKEPGAIQCLFCVCKFTNKDELITHLKTHIKGTKKVNLINNSREGKDTPHQLKADCMDCPITLKEGMALRCSNCFKEFLNEATFKMHRLTHSEAKPYTCTVCGEGFRKSSSLKIHEKTHWPVKPYACTVCGKGFIKLKELKSHSHMHSGEMPFSCANCGQAFSTLEALRSHQVSKVCFDKSDEADRNTVNGFLVTQGVEGQIKTPLYYKCPICKQLHHHWCHYVLHLQTHTKSQPYLCDTCGQQYDQVTQTNIHCKVCCNLSGEERACNASLIEIWEKPKTTMDKILETETTMDQILEPETTIDQILEPETSMDQILKPETTMDQILEPETTMEQICEPPLDTHNDHEISPVGDQNLQNQELETIEKEMTDILQTPPPPRRSSYLDIMQHSPSNSDCGNDGSTSPSVMSCGSEQTDPQPPRFHPHSLIHRHYSKYSCGPCGKSFNQQNRLWLHQGLHRQRGGSSSCTQCGLQFRFFSSYMDHLLEHAAQRPYACPLCPKTFSTEETLNTHHCEYHKPRRCTKCGTCGKGFTCLTRLKRHSLLHRGVSSHFCLPCNLSFPSTGALQNHLKTHRVRPSVPLPESPVEPFLFPYRCRKCTAKFTSSDLLQAHQVCHFIAGREPARPPADVLSSLPIRDAREVISESSRQIRSLPVSNKKHLFRYPHPDRLYVVPIVSSEPPVVISDAEEEIVVVSPLAPNSISETVLSPVNEIQPSVNNDCSDQNVSNIHQSSALYTPLVIHKPETTRYRPMTQTDTPHRPVGDAPLPHALDQVPIHNEWHQNHETSTDIDVASDCNDDSSDTSTTSMTHENECPIDVHNCAMCKEHFRNISKLHEHYLDHARGIH